MSEEKAQDAAEVKNGFRKTFNLLVFVLAVCAIAYLVVNNFDTFKNILLVVIGFGLVVVIHEFGHFIVAKNSGIKVEAFSIGFPPTLLGIQKTEVGIRFRILPKFFGSMDDDESMGGLIFTIPKKCKPSDTEYRLGIIPFGGFVKMLGQEDAGPAEQSDDPRSYANKPIMVRIAVVAAGVIFNAISAVLVFMMVFLVGKNLPPAVIGGVYPGSPADVAGLRPGDRIIEVEGDRFVDSTSLIMAAALSGKGEAISFLVQHPDGTEEPFNIVAEKPADADAKLRQLGIEQAGTLVIERGIKDPNGIKNLKKIGFQPGDVVTAVNGRSVRDFWQFEDVVKNSLSPSVLLTVERTDTDKNQKTLVDVELPLLVNPVLFNFKTQYDLAHVYSMIPRLKIDKVSEPPKPFVLIKELKAWWKYKILKHDKPKETKPVLLADDIIIKIADTDYPTFRDLREVTKEHEDKPMPITVLRTKADGTMETIAVSVTPKKLPGSKKVTIGIETSSDFIHPVAAQTVDIQNGPSALNIPSGAVITQVDGEPVTDYYDIVRLIRKNRGQTVSIDYIIYDQPGQNVIDGGAVTIDIPLRQDYITAKTNVAVPVPFELLKEKYKASGPIEAISMGMKKTYQLIAQTYLTLRRLIVGDVGTEALSGPVGIVTMSYQIASRSLSDYVYFLALISAIIAVMNLLPLPIVDGGVILMLIIEKIKGSPISQRAQEIVSYAGLILLLAIFLWITYNDIIRLLFGG